jgi:chemotaxis protein MotB
MTVTLYRDFSNRAGPFVRQRKKNVPLLDVRHKRIWLVSFTDFMSLMVAFFVMSYSMVEPRQEEFQRVNQALKNQFETVPRIIPKPFMGAAGNMGQVDTITLPRAPQRKGLDLGYLTKVLEAKRAQNSVLKNMKATEDDTGLMVSVPLSDLMVPNSMKLSPKAEVLAYELAGLLQGMPNRIELVMISKVAGRDAHMTSLQQGLVILSALRRAGLNQDLPVLVHNTRALDGVDTASVALRLTPYEGVK